MAAQNTTQASTYYDSKGKPITPKLDNNGGIAMGQTLYDKSGARLYAVSGQRGAVSYQPAPQINQGRPDLNGTTWTAKPIDESNGTTSFYYVNDKTGLREDPNPSLHTGSKNILDSGPVHDIAKDTLTIGSGGLLDTPVKNTIDATKRAIPTFTDNGGNPSVGSGPTTPLPTSNLPPPPTPSPTPSDSLSLQKRLASMKYGFASTILTRMGKSAADILNPKKSNIFAMNPSMLKPTLGS